MASYSGTAGNDAWTVINPGTFTLDGLGGSDTLYLGTSLRSSFNITRSADGAVHVDSISGASGALHATLVNMEKLVFNNRQDTLDLATYFGDTHPQALVGTAGNDVFTVGTGSTTVNGLAGIDTIDFSGVRTAFQLGKTTSGYQVAAHNGSETVVLTDVERLHFNDINVALDLGGHAGEVAKVLGAVFGASAVSNQSYAGIGLQLLDGGMSYPALCELAVSVTGQTSHDDIVTLLWRNVVGTTPTAADKAPFIAMLDQGMSVGELTAMAADTAINQTHIDLIGLAQTGLDYV